MLSCAACGGKFERSGSRGPDPRFCSATCREREKYKRRKASTLCPGCGETMAPAGAQSAADPKCRRCRMRGHGTYAMYKKRGCRCPECRKASARENSAYRKRRAMIGNPVEKAREPRTCDYCASSFQGRKDTGQRFCSAPCARDAQGRRPVSQFKIKKSVRLAIYEACGWQCQLCFSPVRPDEDPNHPRYPTLDHIQPRARGGSDDASNLRLACRQCNTLRGTNVEWTPVRLVA